MKNYPSPEEIKKMTWNELWMYLRLFGIEIGEVVSVEFTKEAEDEQNEFRP